MDTSETYIKMCEKAFKYIGLVSPRQDQLQGMISTDFWECWDGLDKYVHAMQYPLGLQSMEQLWLVFLMRTKYAKTWNGEDWVAIN